MEVSFIGGKNWITRQTHQPLQVTDKRYHILLNQGHLTINGVRIHNCGVDNHKCLAYKYIEFDDTKCLIRIRISKKNRQHNGQKKKYKRTNNDLQNIPIKIKME